MGLYDRDYVRDDEPRGFFLGGDRAVVTNLVIINVVVFLADLLLQGRISYVLRLGAGDWREPWRAYELLTYGFLHDPDDIKHILFNMISLWMFGRELEMLYGRKEFLRFYLAVIVLCGAAWVVWQNLVEHDPLAAVIGASGGVTAVLTLFILHFPKRVLLFMGILPIPAWLLGVLMLLGNLNGMGMGNDHLDRTAYEIHLCGAGLALGYWASGMRLGKLVPSRLARLRWPSRGRLRVHNPRIDEEDLNERVDQILAKISEQGETSLSREERKLLEDASRRYQQKRR